MSVVLRFPGYRAVLLPDRVALAEHLTALNSPVLFGCRTGICGTCLVRAEGAVEPPDEDEREVLDIYAHGDASARLACQLACTGEVHLTPHPDAP